MLAKTENPSGALLSTIEAAPLIGVSPGTLENWRIQGRGPEFIKTNTGRRGKVLYDPADIEAWKEANRYASTLMNKENQEGCLMGVDDVQSAEDVGSTNPSGIVPMDKRVLVKPDTVESITKGGIILPGVEKEQMAQTKATVIAVGETAWSEAIHDARNFGTSFAPPASGSRVLISKYGGIEVKGADGETYRLLNDEDVTARLEE